jgi:plasminogen activator inhibitor 1 RNA-binding protein
MASNRFAELSPDFDEEDSKKKQIAEQKAKKDAVMKKQEEVSKANPKQERMTEGEGFQSQGVTERGTGRGTGRGMRRPYRGRGGYGRGGEGGEYIPREKHGSEKQYHYQGNNDPAHPFDRKSGTGRGTEISKRGGGARNWGRPEDDIKNLDKVEGQELTEEKVVKEGETEVKPAETKEEETGQPKYRSKRDKKKGKKDEKEEQKEESMDPTGTALTFAEYQAKLAEKQKDLPTKKAPEAHIVKDPKTIAGLVAYEKPKEMKPTETKTSKKKTVNEESEKEKIVLGAFIDAGYKPRREEAPVVEAPKPEGKAEMEERPQRGRGYRGQRRGGYESHKVEERKPQPATFVLKEDDFPTLK